MDQDQSLNTGLVGKESLNNNDKKKDLTEVKDFESVPKEVDLCSTSADTSCSDSDVVIISDDDDDENPFTYVTIVSRDGYEIPCKWDILAGRSPVFKAMYEAGLQERVTEVISMKMLSKQSLRMMMYFIRTGDLPDSMWENDESVLVELVEAAGIFHINELLHIIDKSLSRYILVGLCAEEMARKFLVIAQSYDLKACDQLLKAVNKFGFTRIVRFVDENEVIL